MQLIEELEASYAAHICKNTFQEIDGVRKMKITYHRIVKTRGNIIEENSDSIDIYINIVFPSPTWSFEIYAAS